MVNVVWYSTGREHFSRKENKGLLDSVRVIANRHVEE
jgi:hypothetical protein